MLVSDIARRVRNQFGDSAGVQLIDQMFYDWINDAMREIVVANDLLHRKSTSSTVINQADYALPTDILKMHSILYQNTKLKFENTQSIDYDRTLETGTPQYYSVYANTLTLFPKPSAVGTMLILYTRTPVEVTAMANTPELPIQYHTRIVEYCLAQASELDDDSGKYQTKISEFRNNTEGMLDEATEDSEDFYPFPTVSADIQYI